MEKEVPGFGGFYSVTDGGQVRSLRTGKLLSQRTDRHGYRVVSLFDGSREVTRGVHQLVALAFLGEIPAGCEVHHMDHEKGNNSAENLCYVSHTENVRARRKHEDPAWVPKSEREKPVARKRGPKPMAVKAVPVTGGDVREFATVQEAVVLGFSPQGISMCLTGKLRSHRGYRFERAR